MKKRLIELGFEEKGIKNSLIGEIYSLQIKSKHGKRRSISVSNPETPNEIIAIAEFKRDPEIIEDLVVVHNYDYDGYISIDRIESLVFALTGIKKINKQ